VTHKIAPQLHHLAVPLDTLTPHPANPNEGDVGALAHQLDTHGQHTPILVQAGSLLILAGNHRWLAARHLGWTHIAATVVDVDETEALEILVGDNRPQRLSQDDPDALEAVLTRLHEAGRLDRSGYDADDLDDLVKDPKATTPGLPTVSVKLPPPTYETWCALVAEAGTSEAELFALLVEDATS
jgi:ParB-like chromosome segregation protein Spo0J